MEVVDTAQINSFAPIAAQTDFVPLSDLKATIANLQEDITALEATQEQDTNRICVDIAHDRQRIAKLEQREPGAISTISQPTGAKTLARITKIDEILKARGSTTLKEIGRILKISPKEVNRILAKLDMRRYELHTRPGDAREKVLRLRVQIH
jgi:hypothetical protein